MVKIKNMNERKSEEGPYVNLPFKRRVITDHEDFNEKELQICGIYRLLPDKVKTYARKDPHLHEYLHIVPIDKVGIPRFYPKLSPKLRNISKPNLIYPVGDNVYIHIYYDANDLRNYYIPIEPMLLHSVEKYVKVAEEKMVDYLRDITVETFEEKKEILQKVLKSICVIEKETSSRITNPWFVNHESPIRENTNATFNLPYFRKNLSFAVVGAKIYSLLNTIGAKISIPLSFTRNKDDGLIHISPHEYNVLEYALLRDKLYLGILHPFVLDPYLEDVTADGVGPIYIEHKIFGSLKSVIEFKKEEDIDNFVVRLAERVGKPITYKNPIVDTTLPDGSRLNIVYGDDITLKGSNFSIRKFTEVPYSILDLIERGTLNYEMAAYLWLLIENKMSFFVSGETASGKTTTMNALTTFIPSHFKIVSIEDTPELQVPLPHWTREVARVSERGVQMGEGTGSDVTMFDLLKAALRQRPNYIIVGEIRGAEGNIAFQSIQTGHPLLSTFHASSVEKLIQRITGPPINIPKTFIDNLNAIIIQSAVRRPDGSVVRRVLSVNEVIGYNPQKSSVSFVRAFQWDPTTDRHIFTAANNSYLLESKIARNLGIPEERTYIIYNEIEKRKRMLERIHERGITNFYDLYHTISRIHKEGILKIESVA
ncbi:type II/IV secretion system ATPase subunit [Candidatus Methanoliparum sp. LAM-1]|uniref:type II/IV secretion system ATPase subunit n=1 Tax=Candidatus Methanoliparum sp. LAM-1 TaxID=2874846 RepID=UPI001E2D50DE|nr:type II/IV secretion system ATPase subunit [Candidatus Methanoliparum sp. LAM-1]BDC35677.1 secretion system protein E [Candidatus Methanoliparum sp. LAM-1]